MPFFKRKQVEQMKIIAEVFKILIALTLSFVLFSVLYHQGSRTALWNATNKSLQNKADTRLEQYSNKQYIDTIWNK